MTERQTRSFLIRRFREAGVRPDTRHGQNFLIDLNLVDLLARSAKIGPQDVVLEIGTGTGSLTAMLARQAAAVVTVEISAELYQLAREELIEVENVTMLHQDALRNKNNLHPNVLQAVDRLLDAQPGRRLKLVSNLPYNIATPVISNLLTRDRIPFSMTVTIQKELAQRITARPSTKDYSALSVWIQCQCDAEVIRVMPPTVFWPRPKVDSAIIHIQADQARRARIADRSFFHRFVRSLFIHRRKYLRSGVLSAYKKQLTKPVLDQILTEQGLGPDARAEQLDVAQLLRLCDSIQRVLPEQPE